MLKRLIEIVGLVAIVASIVFVVVRCLPLFLWLGAIFYGAYLMQDSPWETNDAER